MARPKVSATVLTRNNARTLERCLRSIQWVDEIVVVDSFSTDATLDIAKNYTDRIFQREWPGFLEQRNFSKRQARGEWILWIDADEEVSPALREEMEEELEKSSYRIRGYYVPRCSYYLGRWIRHGAWYPDYVLRLFRSEGVWWEGEPHPRINIKGPIRYLKNDLWHYNYADISEQILTINRYSSMSARELHEKGMRFSYRRMLLHPLFRFLKEYILKQGFRDGLPGLIIVISTMYYVFTKYAKLWEMERSSGQ